MSKKDKHNRCTRCGEEIEIIDYCKDGAIWECPTCGESGVTRMRSNKDHGRKIKEIPDS